MEIRFDVDAAQLVRVLQPLRLDLTYRTAEGSYRARLMLDLLRNGQASGSERHQWHAGEENIVVLAPSSSAS